MRNNAENDPPVWCLVCKVGSDGETYPAFRRKHQDCVFPPTEVP